MQRPSATQVSVSPRSADAAAMLMSWDGVVRPQQVKHEPAQFESAHVPI
jgi:hypothetical protein